MTHRVGKRKLGLPSDQRKALLTSLVRALFQHDKIVTTVTRAKETRCIAEHIITFAKSGTLADRRQVRRMLVGHSAAQPKRRIKDLTPEQMNERSLITGESLVKRLFDEIAPRYKERNGGYTRIVRIGQRRGDAAEIVELSLLD